MITGKRIVKTALDDLPYGPEDYSGKLGPVEKFILPEGVTRRRMLRDVIIISWPSLVELILTQLTSMADQIMVGRMPGIAGIQGLSAVGLAGLPKLLLMTMIMAMNVGSTAMVARYRGQQNQKKANQVFRQALIMNIVLAAVFMIVGLTLSRQLIGLMSGSAISQQTMDQAVQYLNIQLYGMIPLGITITITAVLRGIGDTRMPMIYNTVANVVNIIANYALIYGKLGCPELGVTGASIATVIGQNVAFVMALCAVLGGKRYVRINFREKFKFDGLIMKNVISIGVPSMVEQLLMRMGMIVFTRCVSGLGDMLYATHNVCMNIQSMSFMLGQAFANATTTLMGQSMGKRRFDMAAGYTRLTVVTGIFASILFGIVLAVFGEFIVGIYNDTPEVISLGGQVMILIAFGQPIQTVQFIISGGLRGAGDTKYAAVVTATTVLCVRCVLVILAVNFLNWGLWGAWFALMADQTMRSVAMTLRYRSGRWKKIGMRISTESTASGVAG